LRRWRIGLAAEITHQITFAFFADMAIKTRGAQRFSSAMARSAARTAPLSETPAEQPPAKIEMNVVVFARGQHPIEMGCECDDHSQPMCADVAGAIQARRAADPTQLGQHPFGAFAFKKVGGRDAAQLDLPLIDPVLFTSEETEALAHRHASG